MTWTYTSTNITSSGLSWVRLTIGDNTSAAQQLMDEEILALISTYGSQLRAAIAAAKALGAKYARQADKTVGRLSISASQIAKNYYELADQLEEQLGTMTGGAGGMYAGGISEADKDIDRDDLDRPVPAFALGQFDVTPASE